MSELGIGYLEVSLQLADTGVYISISSDRNLLDHAVFGQDPECHD